MIDDVRPQLRKDGLATRRRLLEAATEEFAARGIAGARVDRIALTARANKSQLYTYFGSKERLFDAVLRANSDAIVDAAPLDANDLPGYATSLYDAFMTRPELVRLAAWNRLERRPTGPLFGDGPSLDPLKVHAVASAQAAGAVTPAIDAADVFAMVIALAVTWSAASLSLAGSADEHPGVHESRRLALAQAVRGAFSS